MIPLYGFLQGDTIGLLLLAEEDETIGDLTRRLQEAAQVRVAPRQNVRFVHGGRTLDPGVLVRRAGLEPLDRVDVMVSDSGKVDELRKGL